MTKPVLNIGDVEWREAVNIGDTTTVYVIIEPKINEQEKKRK